MLARLLICVFCAGLTLYKYIDHLNRVTEVKLLIPILSKDLKEIKEKNLELEYEIESFESPIHLMELMRKPEFGHLKHPSLDQILLLPEADYMKH